MAVIGCLFGTSEERGSPLRNYHFKSACGYVCMTCFGLPIDGVVLSILAHSGQCYSWAGGPGLCKVAPGEAMESKSHKQTSFMAFASVPISRLLF